MRGIHRGFPAGADKASCTSAEYYQPFRGRMFPANPEQILTYLYPRLLRRYNIINRLLCK